uniref:DNA replication licensing factor MCM7 n=1 Tax=Parascaris equorum TaxID=6256 RepID=A0A914RN50_PAREQ
MLKPPVRDALDAFIFQRIYMDRTQKETGGQMFRMGNIRNKYPPELMRRFEVAFKSRTLDKPLSVREVKAAQVGKLVTVSGVVIRATEVKPMASVITYTCDTCGSETYQPDCVDTKAHGRLQMQVRGSKFVKFQELRIQEMACFLLLSL